MRNIVKKYYSYNQPTVFIKISALIIAEIRWEHLEAFNKINKSNKGAESKRKFKYSERFDDKVTGVKELSKAKLYDKESQKSEYEHEGDISGDLYNDTDEEPTNGILRDHISISDLALIMNKIQEMSKKIRMLMFLLKIKFKYENLTAKQYTYYY